MATTITPHTSAKTIKKTMGMAVYKNTQSSQNLTYDVT